MRERIARASGRSGRLGGVSPDGTLLATGDGDGTVRLRDLATCRPVASPVIRPPGDVARQRLISARQLRLLGER
jgi:WD40 repeat protein